MPNAPIRVNIRQEMPGFEKFFSAWLLKGEKTYLVDTGPKSTGGLLVEKLEEQGVQRLDYVLLTHIHIDHGGGVGAVLDRYPEAKVVCHAKGVRFMIDPEKLYEGSVAVLGDLAVTYGKPASLPPEKVVAHTDADIEGLTIIETPGHAPHHLAFRVDGFLFSGEAGGNLFLVDDRQYLRPATPHRFFLEQAVESVEKLEALPDSPIYYAHSQWAESSRSMLERFRTQLYRWRDIVSGVVAKNPDDLESACVEALIKEDPELAALDGMDEGARSREYRFIGNSVRGYLGYLKEKADA